MEREKIREEVVGIIAAQLTVAAEMITDDVALVSLGADSLDGVEMIMELEDRFSIVILDDEAEKLTTLGQIVEYLVTHPKPAAPDEAATKPSA